MVIMVRYERAADGIRTSLLSMFPAMTDRSCRLFCGLASVVLMSCYGLVPISQAAAQDGAPRNLVWDTPSENEHGSMPIGNGELAANVWMEPGGDLVFYISKTDSWSEHARPLKLGRVRVKTTPAFFSKGSSFRQELNLTNGVISIESGKNKLRFWVDANRPVIHVDIASETPMLAQAELELWRTERRALRPEEMDSVMGLKGRHYSGPPVYIEPDIVFPATKKSIRWCHHNISSCYGGNLKKQGLDDLIPKYPDPLINLTFGCVMRGSGMISAGNKTLKSKKPATDINISISALSQQIDSADGWLKQAVKVADKADKTSLKKAFRQHQEWWQAFWKRSWIVISGSPAAESVSRAYNLQRWTQACAGRGAYPIKFNGSIFTVGVDVSKRVPQAVDADYRRWGECYWFQNTRFVYWAMLNAGDYDMMNPLFDMYMKFVPLLKDRTRKYFNHDGIYCGETIYFWGLYSYNDYRTGHYSSCGYIRYYFQSGIELTSMMLDRYIQTEDIAFAKKYIVPFGDEVLKFYDQHYKRDAEGKILFSPAQSLETYRWGVSNPLPVVAGLHAILKRMLSLPQSVATDDQRKRWKRMLSELPEIPIKEFDGKRCLAPAGVYDDHRGNVENPELYSVFPYRIHCIGQPDLEVGLNAWPRRKIKKAYCWHQDFVESALLGLTDEAKGFAIGMAKGKDRGSRFPAFWSAGHDWLPDQDHGGNLMIGLQRMLMQWDDNGKIYLLPTWPKDWDVSFKLHAARKTVVQAKFEKGKIIDLKVSPESRRRDIVMPSGKAEAAAK
jgi:hypothetical protein